MGIKNRDNRFKLITLILIIVSIVLGIFIGSFYKNDSYSEKIVKISSLNKENKLTKKELIKYRKEINNEIVNEDRNFKIKESYYALAVIDFEENKNEDSIENLHKALKYTDNKMDNIDLMIFSALSTNYIYIGNKEESEKYFYYAKEIAVSEKMNNELSKIYYARANAVLNSNSNIEEGINLLEESKEINCNNSNKIDTYLFLASLYRLNNEYSISLNYTEEALELAMKVKNEEKINSSIINLGENYYLQGEYKKAIYIYEKLLDENILIDSTNKLTIIGYLLVSNSEIGNYKEAEKYKDEYLEIVTQINEEDKNREILWLYMVYSNMKAKEGDLIKAKEYLHKSNVLYEEDKLIAYINTDLYLENIEVLVDYKTNNNYRKTLSEYEEFLIKLDIRGIKSDMRNSAINEIINISYENNDYDTTIKYINELNMISGKSNTSVETDSVFEKFSNGIYEKKIHISKLYINLVFSILIITVGTLIVIHLNHKKVKRINLELKEISKIDGLTRVYNKRYMYEIFEELCEFKKSIFFIMIDIDYFKNYNDNYGHVKGDEVLVNVANIMKETFDEDLVFRYGGEEFSIISQLSKEEVVMKIEKLRNTLYEANILHEYSEVSFRLTLSIGVEESRISLKEDIEKIISSADNKLYKSKNNGRNTCTY